MALAGEECTVPSPEPCQEERQAPRASLAAPPPPFGSAAPLAPNPSRARAAERGGLCPMGGACSAEPGRARPTAAGPQLRKLPSPQRRRVGRTGGGRGRQRRGGAGALASAGRSANSGLHLQEVRPLPFWLLLGPAAPPVEVPPQGGRGHEPDQQHRG
ncbi:unnamed protein product [Prorocentrum cordatum]|uniref:Uncharacterized protein n=1 Tax=Prorocentrum cordatum TaxID=2364126 RepID=A0ABN9UFJ8_9DINO|nr:unnamed protein product [Polarella glacialis]